MTTWRICCFAATVLMSAAPGNAASMFLPADVPANINHNDDRSIELGMKFRSTAAGNITGVRFYKGSQNTGTHTAHLWRSNGQLLSSATFSGETASGWQQVNFPSPIAITANTTYVASYHTGGHYSANSNYFSSAKTNGVLTAPSSSSSGGNGVYRYGRSVRFPGDSYRATNYWVDIVFQSAVTNPDPVAVNDSGFSTAPGTAFTIAAADLLANDTDPNGLPLTVIGVSGAVNGVASLLGTTITFNPTDGYAGPASFVYSIRNTAGLTASATVAIAVVAATPGCGIAYTASGPVVAQTDNQVIANLNITTTNGPGINTNGKSGVQIKNVTVHHSGQNPGIFVSGGTNVSIVGADIVNDAAPASGPNSSDNMNNIACLGSSNITVKDVRLSKGSSGIYLINCPGSKLSFIEGHEHRGPFPRGQLVQWDKSNNGSLADFSTVNNVSTSWTEDNINVYQTTGITVARGLVDGNNSPSGVGVIVDGTSGNVTVNDVDAIHQGNGCFSVYGGGGHDVTFTNTRCRDNHCSNPRGAPLSNALAFAFDPQSGGNLNLVNSSYFNLCNPGNIVWDASKLTINQVSSNNLTARQPIVAKLCQ